MTDLINILAGLIVGLVTGFFFERRATREARREAEELGRRLRDLQESVYVMGGHAVTPLTVHPTLDGGDLRPWLVLHQDGAGRLPRSRVFDHLLERGHGVSAISDALAQLEDNGDIRMSETWIEVVQ